MSRRRTRRVRALRLDPAPPAPTDAGEQGYPPTRETVAKLRTDVVLRLHRLDRLTLEQLQAAEEIRRMWQAMGRGLFPTAGRLDGTGRAPQHQPRHPIDRMTDAEDRIFRRRYRPWAIEIGRLGQPANLLQLVFDMVIDNWGPRQIERRDRLRHGTAAEALRGALQRYAEIAGWVRPHGTASHGPRSGQPHRVEQREQA